MAERIEVDAIIKAISEGFDKVGQDFTKLARESQKAGDAVKGAGDDADDAVVSLDKLSGISRESALRLAALDARASALNTQMRKLAREVEQGNTDVDAATDAYNDLQRELDQTHDAMRDVEREARKLDDSMEDVGDSSDRAGFNIVSLNQGVELLKTAFSTTVEVAKAVFNELERAEQVQALRNTFDNLAGSLGNTDQLLQQLKDSTNGAVSETVLLEAANKALNLGLAGTDQELITLVSNAAALGANLGDVGGTIDDVLAAIANESRLRLDNFGVAASRVEELQDELRAAGEEGSFAQATMIALNETVDRTGARANLAANDMARLQTALKDARNEAVLDLISALGNDLPDAVDNATDVIEEFSDALTSEKIRQGIEAIEFLSKFTAPGMAKALQDALPSVRSLREELAKYSPHIANLVAEQNELERSQRTITAGSRSGRAAIEAAAQATEELASATSDTADELTDYERDMLRINQQYREQADLLPNAVAPAWNLYQDQVEETTATVEDNTAALRRAEVQQANNTARLLALKEEAERLEQQFADLTTELLNNATASGEYDAATVTAATDTSTLAGIMRDSAAAAGLDAEGRALLAVATGELTTAQAAAVLEAAALQAKARELGEAIAAGTITVTEAVAELNNLQASFNAIDTLTARSEIDQLEAALNQIDGRTVRVTVSVDQQGGTTVQQGGQGAGLSEFMSGGFTGNVATNQVAGVVHGQEFVLNAATTRRIGVGNLNALNNGGGLAGVTINGGISIMLANPINATPDQIGTSVANKIGQRLNRG